MSTARRSVDSHAHIFTTALPLAPGHRHAPQYDATLAQYLALLDAHGITNGVLTAPSFLGTDNRHLVAGLKAAGGRLRGTVIVAPDVSDATLAEYASAGVCGIRLNLYKRADRDVPDLASLPYRALFERCAALGWHVEIYGEGPRLARWLPQIMAAPVNVVVDHFGSPDPALGTACPGLRCILSSFATGRLWVKLSAPYRVGGVERASVYARELLREGGPQRLVWGSDWPWTQNEAGRSYRECLDWLAQWVPDAAQREQILGDTPFTLFGFASRLSLPASRS
jgi:predicted TIM-barrel fold metal-dependent hydrolase